MASISIDRTACIRCGACVEVCASAQVFELDEQASNAVRPEACWGCGHCVAVCPTDAIDHEAFPLEECPICDEGRLPSSDALIAAFRARRSCRTYEENPVPREIVRELASIGRWAPTARNNQAFDWLAFDDPGRIDELRAATIREMDRLTRLAANPLLRPILALALGRNAAREAARSRSAVKEIKRRAAAGDDPLYHHAPLLLIGHAAKGNSFGRDDAIYAAYNLMLAADRRGLASCQIGLFQIVAERSRKLRQVAGIPAGRAPQVAVALGYPHHPFRRLLPRRVPNLSWNPR